MPLWTIDLGDPGAADPRVAGGKGAGLAHLIRAGLPVPRGFAMLPDAMRAAAGSASPEVPRVWSDAAVRAEAQRQADRLRSAPLPAGLAEEVRIRLAAMGNVAVAVRSSALDEDGALRSAAGQHDSILSVRGTDDVLAAIREVWASINGHRAAIYRSRTGASPFGELAAVVVQEMAPADIAGVIFTADPISRHAERLVVEMARGESVVAGTSEAQRAELDRDGRVLLGPADSLLDDSRLAELARIALAAETARGAGEGVDVEWAFSETSGFALLQVRPITEAPARVRAQTQTPRRRGVIWTRRFSGERWTEPATPLGWSIVEPVLERFTHWEWVSRRYLRGSRSARLHAGTPYFNVTIFRHLLLKTPWTPTPEFVLELFPAEEREEWNRRRWILPTPGVIVRIIAEALFRSRWRGHRWLWLTNPRDWSRLSAEIATAAAQADRRPPDFGSAMRELDRLLLCLDRYVGTHVWSLLWANLFYQLLSVLLEKAGGAEMRRRLPALIAGDAGENMTLRTNAAIWGLAAVARSNRGVEGALATAPDGESARIAVAALGGEEARRFLADLDGVLERFGHRSRASWEVFSRRWRDEPGLVLEMVRACLRAGGSADPFLDDEKRKAARREAESALDAALHRRPALRLATRWSLRNARVFSLLRENQRFVFDPLMLAIGDVCRAAAVHLERAWRLARASDVVWLSLPEVRDLGAARLSAPEAARRIAARKAHALAAQHAWAPTFLYEDEHAQNERAAPGRVLRGVGVSPGRVTGRVRIARSLEDVAHIEPGDILVVRASDSGWTPYFPVAGALVAELGGMLSHAAVVAREYGLPAVANVAGATEALEDGERVTVDGDAGTVSRETAGA